MMKQMVVINKMIVIERILLGLKETVTVFKLELTVVLEL